MNKIAIMLFVSVLLSIPYTVAGRERDIHPFRGLKICAYRWQDCFSGIQLFKEDLREGQIVISGQVRSKHPIKEIFASTDGGNNWEPASVEDNNFEFAFVPGEQPNLFRVSVRCIYQTGSQEDLPFLFSVEWTAAGLREQIRYIVEDIFSSLARGIRKEVLQHFSSRYERRYELEDRIALVCDDNRLSGFRLFFGSIMVNQSSCSADLEWEATENGVVSSDSARFQFCREDNGRVTVRRVRGSNIF
ncbi:MAG: hypothetical protein PHQ23_07475 [Candidatus Wallbacteria bacterium]|nr:hypothetical protein [Candidatus Wallbacteria bacterium]